MCGNRKILINVIRYNKELQLRPVTAPTGVAGFDLKGKALASAISFENGSRREISKMLKLHRWLSLLYSKETAHKAARKGESRIDHGDTFSKMTFMRRFSTTEAFSKRRL